MLCVSANCVVRAPGAQDFSAKGVTRISFARSWPDMRIMEASLPESSDDGEKIS